MNYSVWTGEGSHELTQELAQFADVDIAIAFGVLVLNNRDVNWGWGIKNNLTGKWVR